MVVTREAVLEALRRVKAPDHADDIVARGLVSEVVVKDGQVMFAIEVDPARAREMEPVRRAAEVVVSRIDGVDKAMVTLTAEKSGGGASAPAGRAPAAPGRAPQQAARGGPVGPGGPAGGPAGPGGPAGGPPPQARGVPGIKHIIAVASGKGGVGKSTTAVNLALGLKSLGLSIGVLDADIYGPSQPRLLGVSGRPDTTDGRILVPMEGHGIKVMSMGFLVEEETPMIWRGPMVISALTQMLREVRWGDLDVLVVDMPPGTGDAQLTMAQQVPLAGAVIVSTPQDLALIDARKGINMFARVSVPILGIIENMSFFLCPSCGTRSDIFGHGGAEQEAEKLGVPFLGAVPLHMAIRETSDAGRPVVSSEPDSPHARIFRDIAQQVWAQLDQGEDTVLRPAPKIVIES